MNKANWASGDGLKTFGKRHNLSFTELKIPFRLVKTYINASQVWHVHMCTITKMAALKSAEINPHFSCVQCIYGIQKACKTSIWLFNATTVHLTLLLILRKAEKTTTDSDLKNNFSAKPGHVNHRLEQPYFVKTFLTSISKSSPWSNLPFSFVPEMCIKMLFLTQSKTTNLCTCREWSMLSKSTAVKI